jgi:hypothetical protein
MRISVREVTPSTWVLWRSVLYPTSDIWRTPEQHLHTYPMRVLYGGPTQAQNLEGPMGDAFRIGMAAWAMNQSPRRLLASETIPIAPSQWPPNSRAPAWSPGWRWWYATETTPVQRFALHQETPNHYDWRPVAA